MSAAGPLPRRSLPLGGTGALLSLRPQITAAAVYRADGALFASYVSRGTAEAAVPARAGAAGVAIDNDRVELFQTIVENKQPVGTVYLRSRFDILDRLFD